MKIDQIQVTEQVLKKSQLKHVKGGATNLGASTSIIIIEDIDIM